MRIAQCKGSFAERRKERGERRAEKREEREERACVAAVA
jgi:hypothetical protein